MTKSIGVFVAWPYANGGLHLGHIAGAYLPADIFARYHRIRGNEVLMLSGSDTHGTPITLKAREENTSPWAVVERFHFSFLNNWKSLGISFDLFTHTHTKNHIDISQQFFLKLHENGDLLIKTEVQLYDEVAQVFLPDRYVVGTCPKCGNKQARGDQCETCSTTYAISALLDPISRISNTKPIFKETQHFFFDIAKYKEKLTKFIDSRKNLRIAVENFSKAMIEGGLEPRPITRDINWGVPVPIQGWDGKVLYVWFDAVIGYYSGAVEYSKRIGDDSAWEKWWKKDAAEGYYFIGKDNVPFHTVIWPAEIMAFDSSLNLPYDVPANNFLNFEGEKFSTSRGIGVWLDDILRNFDPDAVRYYLASIFPETKDANFSSDEFTTRNNGELLAAWGNLVNRVFGFVHAKFNSQVPEPLDFDERDNEILAKIESSLKRVSELIEGVHLRDGLKEAMSLTRDLNKYLDGKAPWTEFKTNPASAGTTMFVALRAIDSLKIMFAPFLPFTSEKIHAAFNYDYPLFGDILIQHDNDENYDFLFYDKSSQEREYINRWRESSLQPGTVLQRIAPLFKILEKQDK